MDMLKCNFAKYGCRTRKYLAGFAQLSPSV